MAVNPGIRLIVVTLNHFQLLAQLIELQLG